MAVWSEVTTIELFNSNRIDSEFFKPEYYRAEKLIRSIPHSNLDINGIFLSGPFGSAFHVRNYDVQSDFRYIRGRDVKPFILQQDANVYLPENDYRRLIKYSLASGDVLISVVGTLGNVSIVREQETPSIFSCKSTVFRASTISAYYLLAFLNSKYGKLCLLRRQRGAVQTGLNIEDLKSVPIPNFSTSKCTFISKFVKEGINNHDHAKFLYKQAQKILKAELGLDKLKFEKTVGYETSFSEAIDGRRIDAQCYKPEHINYEKFLRKNRRFECLRDLLAGMIKGKQMATLSDGPIEYVSIKDIQGLELITDSFCAVAKDICIAKCHDLLLAITGATIGKIGIVERYEHLAFCGDLLALRVNDTINKFYLLAVLQSPIGQSQCQRWITGSTNGHLSPRDVGKFVIPRLSEAKEQKIAGLLQKSLEAKQQSEQLLEKAKHRVEELIEEAVEQ